LDATLRDDAFISLKPPSHCPACGSETYVETPRNRSQTSGQVIRCGGPALLCPPRTTLAIQHAFSRDALDISGLSDARIRQLMDSDLIRMPSDLFELVKNEENLEKLAQLEGWGPLSVENLKEVTERVAEEGVSLGKFLYSLNIRSIGAQTALLIANAYRTPERFWNEVAEASKMSDDTSAFPTLRQESEMTKGVGPVIISALFAFAKDEKLTRAGMELSARVRIHEIANTPEVVEDSSARPWRGMSVVFTGTLPAGMSRSDAQALAKDVLGAKSTPARLSKSTNVLVVGTSGGKKREQAGELGVLSIDAHEFLDLVEKVKASR
jgi:DNA ligase (NAD+)